MKKIVILLIALLIPLLVGCSKKTKTINEEILDMLKEHNYISVDSEFVETIRFKSISRTDIIYDVYRYDHDKYTLIIYNYGSVDFDNCDFSVTIYPDTKMVDNIEYIDDISNIEEYYKYEDGKTSKNMKYELSSIEYYRSLKQKTDEGDKCLIYRELS
jgi:hypothetical protein